LYYSKALLECNQFDEAIEVYGKVDIAHFDVHIKNFSLMNYYKIGADIHKYGDSKKAMLLKRTSLEIASSYQFRFFKTLYS